MYFRLLFITLLFISSNHVCGDTSKEFFFTENNPKFKELTLEEVEQLPFLGKYIPIENNVDSIEIKELLSRQTFENPPEFQYIKLYKKNGNQLIAFKGPMESFGLLNKNCIRKLDNENIYVGIAPFHFRIVFFLADRFIQNHPLGYTSEISSHGKKSIIAISKRNEFFLYEKLQDRGPLEMALMELLLKSAAREAICTVTHGEMIWK